MHRSWPGLWLPASLGISATTNQLTDLPWRLTPCPPPQGADTVIYERLDHKHPQNLEFKAKTTEHMEEYGCAGLRTLCLSYAEIAPDFYAE